MRFDSYYIQNQEIIIPIPESYKDCLTLVKSDNCRSIGIIPGLFRVLINLMMPFRSSVLFWYRMTSFVDGWAFGICRYMYERASRKSHVQIPYTVKAGYGLYLGHSMCIIVNGHTVIGNNVNLSQFLNIGSNNEKSAIIGDNVYIAPHVCLIEDVQIGSFSTIGAGAVVVKDVPENATVVGVPAKVVNYDNPGRFVHNLYPISR